MPNYYIDSIDGLDSNDGLAETRAYKTIARAQQVSLKPGDSLLFRRGGMWVGNDYMFTVNAAGTSTNPIKIGVYGVGARPVLQLNANGIDGDQIGIRINGSYIEVSSLRITLINPYLKPDANYVKFGWYLGAIITGYQNKLIDCEFDHLALGIFLNPISRSNLVTRCHFHDLDVLWRVVAPGAMGALGVLLHGNDQEVSYCRFENNGASWGTLQTQGYSAPFELYNANRAHVHHNIAIGHRKHIEIGKASGSISADNLIEYNLFASNKDNARGPNIHGNDEFGPIDRTVIRHNTIVFTGAGSQAIISGYQGSVVQDNILSGIAKAGYFVTPLIEDHNIFYGGQVQFTSGSMSPLSKKIDPKLGLDYKPLPLSPALGTGTSGTNIGAFQESNKMSISIAEIQQTATSIRQQAETKAAEAAQLLDLANRLDKVVVDLQTADQVLTDLITP